MSTQTTTIRVWSLPRARRMVAVLVGLLFLNFGTAGCGSVLVDVNPVIGSCKPEFKLPAQYGRISISQASNGGTIKWGFYPAAQYTGDRYKAWVYMDGKRKDYKDQSYAPHGSLVSTSVKPGKIFRVTAESWKGGELVLRIGMQCYAQ